MPIAVKQNIANLAAFIFTRTLSIESDPKAEKMPSLININREIAAGLRGQ